MSKLTTENKAAALVAGYAAAKAGKYRAPALCPAYKSLIVGFAIGEGGATLADLWFKGYQARLDEETAAAVLAANKEGEE